MPTAPDGDVLCAGVLGAAEVGMLCALLEAGIMPDLVLGTSIGAIGSSISPDNPCRSPASP